MPRAQGIEIERDMALHGRIVGVYATDDEGGRLLELTPITDISYTQDHSDLGRLELAILGHRVRFTESK